MEMVKDYCLSRGIELRLNEPLSRHTSLRTGGPADMALFPGRDDLPDLLRLLREEETPFLVMGGGTNLLVRDGGVRGAVVFTSRLQGVLVRDQGIVMGAGLPLQKAVGLSANRGLTGMEGLSGIPGSVGGALFGNAGSYGCEIGDLVESLEIISDCLVRTLRRDEAGFRYRGSAIPQDSVIVSALLSLKEGEPQKIRERITENLREKRAKQPVALASAGCVFKNPEAVTAGRLIDEAGCKGMRAGGMEVSGLHANFFVNTGGGTARDFLRLMDEVRERVAQRFNITLEPEVRIVGRENDAQ